MKILYITAALPYGSGEAFAVGEIDLLRALGHEILVVPAYPRGEVMHVPDQWLDGVVSEKPLSLRMAGATLAKLRQNPKCLLRIACAIGRSRNPRILLKNAAVVPKGIWTANLAREWGAHHIHAYWAGCAATIALVAAECSGLPWSFTAHRWDIFENNLLDLKSERAAFVRFIAADGQRLAHSLGAAKVAEKGHVMHLGVELPPDPAPVRPDRKPPVLLCAAALSPVKGHAHLIRSIEVLRSRGVDCELWLAGDGVLRAELEQQTRALGLEDRVRFLGQLSHDRLLDMYRTRAVHGVVLASDSEGIPVSLMEAMSFGVPVIATRVGGNEELLGDRCGIMVRPRDPAALADAIERILTNPALAVSVGAAGRARIEERFSIDRNTRAFASLLTSAIHV
jgi:glycosyltransferase involved in cell wall biosynthesis